LLARRPRGLPLRFYFRMNTGAAESAEDLDKASRVAEAESSITAVENREVDIKVLRSAGFLGASFGTSTGCFRAGDQPASRSGNVLGSKASRVAEAESSITAVENREVDIKEVSQSPATTKEQESDVRGGSLSDFTSGLLLLRRCG
jgi:hypothetical protein